MEKIKQVLKEYSTIIWDWNGTLLDDSQCCVDIVNVFLRERSLPEMTLQRYRQIFGFPVADYYREIGLFDSEEEFRTLIARFVSSYRDAFRGLYLHRGTLELILSFKKAGKKQFVLSASQQGELKEQLKHFDLLDHFDGIQGLSGFDADCKKNAGLELVKREGIDVKGAVMVGDTQHDAEVAQSLGCAKVVLLPHGHHCETRLGQIGGEVVSL